MQVASLQDGSFLKSLESALRFGTALVVQDVEASVDPVLFPVLNREFAKVRGCMASVRLFSWLQLQSLLELWWCGI